MIEKATIIDDEIEIGTPEDIMNRIEDHWFDVLNIDEDDYVFVKKVGKHLVLGKAHIELIE